MHLRLASRALFGVGLLAFAVTAAGPSAWADRAVSTKPVISSVTFSGSVSHPTVTIKGTNFGKQPRHDPGCHPAGQGVCGNYTGYDYGNSLYLADRANGHGFAAGRYRPSIPELDAISFVITKYSATEIVFHFGNWYNQIGMPRYHYQLAADDHVTVTVRGSSRSTTVKYRRFSTSLSANPIPIDTSASDTAT